MGRQSAAKKERREHPELDTPEQIEAFLAAQSAEDIALAFAQLPPERQEAILADEARRSFAEFVRQHWHLVPNCSATLEWWWHLETLCAHAVEVVYGRIEKLAINIGPGHAKSTIMSVLLPAWIWTWWPECQVFCASYSKEFALRDSVYCRAVIESPIYRARYSKPAGWRLRHDQNVKSHFANTRGGARLASGIGGMGRRAHVIIIDDPLEQRDVYSAPARKVVDDWLSQTISQRFFESSKPKLIMIGQRLGDPDAFSGLGDDWEKLVLPEEFIPELRSVTYHWFRRDDGTRERRVFWQDPRTAAGELLHPSRFSREWCENQKKPGKGRLGPDGYQCQRQQQPRSFVGGMFKRSDWRFYKPPAHIAKHYTAPRPTGCNQDPAITLPSMFDDELLSMDAAFKDNPAGSRVAIHNWARIGALRFLMYRHTDWMDFAASKQALVEASSKNPKAKRKLVEDKANGTAIINELKAVLPGIVEVEPEGGKVSRAAAAQPYQRAAQCYLPEGAPWLEEVIGIFAAFPGGEQNDDVDAFSQAMLGLDEQPEAETGRVDWNRR